MIQLARGDESVTHAREYRTLEIPEGSYRVERLTRVFNSMLIEISSRDAALAAKVERLNEEVRVRQAAEASLRQNQSAMLRLSREAGIAEVASGVLHKIGNALTSINISSEMLAQRLETVRARVCATPSSILHPPPGLSSRRTRMVLNYRLLALEWPPLRNAKLQAQTILENLRTGVSHLKMIVSSQQSLARTQQLNQDFALGEAISEALILARSTARAFPPVQKSWMLRMRFTRIEVW